MLIMLFDILKNNKTYSLHELAVLLETDVENVKVHMEYLEHKGYIKRVNVDGNCYEKRCNRCKGCGKNMSFPVMWELK